MAKGRRAQAIGLAAAIMPVMVAFLVHHSEGLAAPTFQLPWPTGVAHSISGNTYGCNTHTGYDGYAIDFGFSDTQPVTAAADGTAYTAENPGGYGHYIYIDHGGGNFTLYAHLTDTTPPGPYAITSGSHVTQGEVIGYAGTSGNSTGVHLHFSARSGGLWASPQLAEPMSGYTGFGNYGFGVANNCNWGGSGPSGGYISTAPGGGCPSEGAAATGTSGTGSGQERLNWYDNASPGFSQDTIHFANMSGTFASGTVATPSSSTSYALANSSEGYVNFAAQLGGPAVLTSSVPGVYATQRVTYYQSFSETNSMDYPRTTEYLMWYDKASCGFAQDNVHVLNTSGSTNSVSAQVGNGAMQSITLTPYQEGYISFAPGTIGGPVTMSGSYPFIASRRTFYYQSFNEVNAEPVDLSSTSLYFMWYDNASPGMVADNIHIYNVNAASTSVSVSIGSGTPQTFTVNPWDMAVFNFAAGTIGGPVHISASNAVLASERVQFSQSFSEVNAMPVQQAATSLSFNWYDTASAGVTSDNIHLANTSSAANSVCLYVPGYNLQCVSLAPGAASYLNLGSGALGGPVTVYSSSGYLFLASERTQKNGTFHELNPFGRN